jgi:hypothetical protein
MALTKTQVAMLSATGTPDNTTFLRGDGVWAAPGGVSGTVTDVSVITANGFGGTVATSTTTPAITLNTNVTGVLKGNGTAISAATAGTDYQAPITLTTTGLVGDSTFSSNTLNVPNYGIKLLASTANSATPTINTDLYNMVVITGQSVAITSFTTNLTGTPVNGQRLWIAITGTAAIAITWGASFEASTVALPTTTVTTSRLDVGFVWNAATSKWRCLAYA